MLADEKHNDNESAHAQEQLLEQLAQHYDGRHASTLLLKWSEQKEPAILWRDNAQNTWSQALAGFDQVPLRIIQQALFDHPSDQLYRAVLPKAENQKVFMQLKQLLRCCDNCPSTDRPYRFGQWLSLLDDCDQDIAFVSGVDIFHLKWSNAERLRIEQQLHMLDRHNEMYNSVEDTLDMTLSLLHALCDVAEISDAHIPPWHNDVEDFQRALSHITTVHQHYERDSENQELRVQRQKAVEGLLHNAPVLIARIDQCLHNHAVHEVSHFLHRALLHIQQAVQDQPVTTAGGLITGLRKSMWATRSADYTSAWTFQSPVNIHALENEAV